MSSKAQARMEALADQMQSVVKLLADLMVRVATLEELVKEDGVEAHE